MLALGVTWVLDGLEVTIVGALGPRLKDPATLALSDADIGALASAYLVGAVFGALVFGWLTDRYGRKVIFFTTLAFYIVGVLLSAFAWDFWSMAAFRLLTGVGIGGEYAAINSAIDELVPARLRGRVALIVNGSFWLGAALGSLASVALLDTGLFAIDLGWRIGFAGGAALGLLILFTRRFVPESPRWLAAHDRIPEGEAVTAEIERRVEAETGQALPPAAGAMLIRPQKTFGFGPILSAMFGRYRGRSALVLVLMAAQAFLYNAIFFSYGLILTRFHAVPEAHVGLYLVPFAIGNFVGPIVLGPLFDTVGRRKMICFTYAALRPLAVRHGMAVRDRRAFGRHGNGRLVRDLLLRLRRRERRLSDRERSVSAGGPRARDRRLLCDRHGDRRRGRALRLRPPDRGRRALADLLGLRLRGGADGLGRRGGARLRNRRGGQAARGRSRRRCRGRNEGGSRCAAKSAECRWTFAASRGRLRAVGDPRQQTPP